MPLKELQRGLAAVGLYYPPVPTFDGAFVGGTIATNAAGAATFKHGSTRRWVNAATIVLASGDVLDIVRGETLASNDGWFEIELTTGSMLRVPVPTYMMPDVPKLSAGYYAKPGMDLIDLFIGAEGTLGIVIEATLKVVARPRRVAALIRCADDTQAVMVTAALRREAQSAWRRPGSPGRCCDRIHGHARTSGCPGRVVQPRRRNPALRAVGDAPRADRDRW